MGRFASHAHVFLHSVADGLLCVAICLLLCAPVVMPGEVLSRLGLGGGDPNQIILKPQNIDPAKAKGLKGMVYLHSVDRVMDDIREFEGVGEPVEETTATEQAKE
jgi:hypothetical protein